jgi:hypothetical protein
MHVGSSLTGLSDLFKLVFASFRNCTKPPRNEERGRMEL